MPVSETSLNGAWVMRVEGEDTWRNVEVPGCWEAAGVPKDFPGPCVYWRRIIVPDSLDGRRLFLRFGGVSYHCSVTVDGKPVGEHTGMWDTFELEITDAVTPGKHAQVMVTVEKPASLTEGPGSPAVPGRFPLPETLAGFLPYVWGHAFGGIWQDVTLVQTGPAHIQEVTAEAAVDGAIGKVAVEVRLDAPSTVYLTLVAPNGDVLAAAVSEQGDDDELEIGGEFEVENPQPWSPESPTLYAVVVATPDGDRKIVRFGFRALATDGPKLLLNGSPLYPRMALSWGWYPDHLDSNPGPERVQADLEKLKSLGFNGVKLCLWFPPEYYFDLADAMGMLLWVELPMWMPNPSDAFRQQLPIEYERLIKQARSHPSVILYSLGCELTQAVGEDVLGPLYTLAKALVGDALVRDNSGSGEAYGGLLNEHADYYDYHFYSDLQFFRPLLDEFAPRTRAQQPFLFGEYCDKDTIRDLGSLAESLGGEPWWTSSDPKVNPQGARWQYDLPFQAERLREAGLAEQVIALGAASRREAQYHRKRTIEETRLYREVSGYVVTGEIDTPISTAGVLDDAGRPKFPTAPFKAFNSDTVLLLSWDKRRAWIRGGDRPAPWDTVGYVGGEMVRTHIVISHYGKARGRGVLQWLAKIPAEPPFAMEERLTDVEIEPGDVKELRVAELWVPIWPQPMRVDFKAYLRIGDEQLAENSWALYVFPPDFWSAVQPFELLDPTGRLSDLSDVAPVEKQRNGAPRVLVATAWSQEVEQFVRSGGKAVLLQGEGPDGPIPVVPAPFWREGVKLVEPHPAWGDFPHERAVGGQFYGMATDLALDTRAVAGEEIKPILRRVDARTAAVHDYAVEMGIGSGKLIVSTLRFEGGLGDQPLGISRNTSAAYLLSRWIRYLSEQPE